MDYALIFVAGFFTSLHCVGMCGAIVIAYSTQYINKVQISPGNQGTAAVVSKPSVLTTLPLHFIYNGGRVLSYTLLGAGMGYLGGTLVALKNASSYVAIISGSIMVISGIFMLKIIPLPSTKIFDKIGKYTSKPVGKVIRENSLKSKFTLGMLTPLFPCGVLYAMLFKAGATQSVLSGALTMLIYGSGMVPALVLTGTASSFFSSKARNIGDKLAAFTIILMGIILLLRGFGIPFLSVFHGSDPPNIEAPCCH